MPLSLITPINPARTIHTPLRLLADPLPTILALYSPLDNIGARGVPIELSGEVKSEADKKKGQELR